MNRFLFILWLLVSLSTVALAQQGEIQGKITDAKTGEAIPFVNVSLTVNGALVGGQTDFDGYYSIKPLPPGTYDVKASYVGYTDKVINGVRVTIDEIVPLDIAISDASVQLGVVEIVEYKVPIFKKDQTSTGNTVTQEEIQSLATRNVNSIAAQTAGVFQQKEGSSINVKGSRGDATDFYIDGIKVRGTNTLPASAIEQMTVVTGGVPARYGDATGGIISITTRGPSKTFSGGIELATSKFLDPYGYYLANFNLAGPLLKTKRNTENERTVAGFFFSGEYTHDDDDDPSRVGIWKVKDDVLEDIRKNPLVRTQSASGFLNATDFITKEDMEHVDSRLNVKKNVISGALKIDIQPVSNLNLTFGSNGTYTDGGMLNSGLRDFNRSMTMFNWERTPKQTFKDYRFFGRLTQRLGVSDANVTNSGDTPKKSSFIQNVYYSVQFDYSKSLFTRQDQMFEDRFFDYGYTGQFQTYREPDYQLRDKIVTLSNGSEVELTGYEFNGYKDIRVEYTPSLINVDRSNLTSQYYAFAGDDINAYSSTDQILLGGGLLNGRYPSARGSSYSLNYVPGYAFDQYWKTNDDQYRMMFNGSFDLKKAGASDLSKHAIEFGFEYEQRIDRSWNISPVDLWTLMRQKINAGITLDNGDGKGYLLIDGQLVPIDQYDGGITSPIFGPNDSITYNLIRTSQETFDRRIRERFNYGTLDFVNTDALDPALLSLDLFTPNDLFTDGTSPLIGYHGFDYLGNKITKQPSFKDFWTAKDAEGNYTRPLGAFRPIYMAGYIQDKFSFKDLIFNIGVRVDRFDANQKAPKDPYSPIAATRKVADVTSINGNSITHPSTVGDDFVVYVNDAINPTAIQGYRDGNQWYNAEGLAISNPKVIIAGNAASVTPYLADPSTSSPDVIQSENYNPDLAFEDYKPQINVMPRIAFSFSISDEAVFFAHYDVLTQRPQNRLQASAYDYYYFGKSLPMDNPALKPEKTVDFQLGFKQKLTQSSAVTLSGFYRDLRDMVQVIQMNYAYPDTYSMYGNQDFGTVKGFEMAYDMRRTNNLRLMLSYTLQFADGTGSGDRSQANLISFGRPNLRGIFPLSYDSRHMLNANVDYRFDEGADYNGPKLWGKDVLANFGVNFNVQYRTGTPYTRQASPTPEAEVGNQVRSSLEGGINSARLPGNLVINTRIEKDFKLNFSRKEGAKDRYVSVYFLVQNLLNAKNIVSVYSATGSPSDDGWLGASGGLNEIATANNAQAFKDQYIAKVDDPYNYGIPRRMRAGIMFNF